MPNLRNHEKETCTSKCSANNRCDRALANQREDQGAFHVFRGATCSVPKYMAQKAYVRTPILGFRPKVTLQILIIDSAHRVVSWAAISCK